MDVRLDRHFLLDLKNSQFEHVNFFISNTVYISEHNLAADGLEFVYFCLSCTRYLVTASFLA